MLLGNKLLKIIIDCTKIMIIYNLKNRLIKLITLLNFQKLKLIGLNLLIMINSNNFSSNKKS